MRREKRGKPRKEKRKKKKNLSLLLRERFCLSGFFSCKFISIQQFLH
ncbi:hypothetical protein ACMBCN_02425 [Candidatus Liberibacter asiaticus]|nr:hypothetical protein [Candidatus Liberibacter asiaticus]